MMFKLKLEKYFGLQLGDKYGCHNFNLFPDLSFKMGQLTLPIFQILGRYVYPSF